ncbi:MAG: dihydroxy-acid dehydratase [Bacteroidetes bacterium RIFCSPHIGHO2_02_FULL_44_7]|nr:MAG: dihydroxy-acid dehydratase [Bacteroidetes bacterium RIFCSPHIGHO2_02_FULL_44_7]
MNDNDSHPLNFYSRLVSGNPDNPAATSMLIGAGLTLQDLNKAQVGVLSTGFKLNTCNMHLNNLASIVEKSIWDAGLVGGTFHASGVSDGISMGTDGMRASLPSRDAIADLVELHVTGEHYDGVIVVPGCDKQMPGSVMALARLNRPGFMLYGGSIAPGHLDGDDLTIVSSFQARSAFNQGLITRERYDQIIQKSCPGAGACGGLFTANTMASAIEAMGIGLPYTASNPAVSKQKMQECYDAGASIKNLLQKGIKPRDIMTKEAFDDAMVMVTVLAGSTNAALHLPAMAHAAGFEYTLDDIQGVSERTPVLGNFTPSGKYAMQDLHNVGGLPALMRYLLDNHMLHGDRITATGKTLEENLRNVQPVPLDEIISPLENPLKSTGHIQIYKGNLGTAVSKITGKEGTYFKGQARVFDSEQAAVNAYDHGEIVPNTVIVIRYEGPVGGPGMKEMLKLTSSISGDPRLKGKVAYITDARFSGGSDGFILGHVHPEAQIGGNLAFVKDGDYIEIDASNNSFNLLVDDETLVTRMRGWEAPALKVTQGALLKYAYNVSQANKGCITDEYRPNAIRIVPQSKL